ncbi:MAG: single-stranded DNA-binding protein [Desulfovibrionaceae bacterium]|nr:single-stranded DNA-binding protein [Desulfovibrionaceae bacterium]
MNKVMLIGRLGRDPEMKYMQNGAAITTFTIATDENWTDRSGERIEHVEWHRIITFQKLAENCAKHIVKGSLVYVQGSLQTRKWQDASGQNRYVTEVKAQRVLFLDRKHQDPQYGIEGEDADSWRSNPEGAPEEGGRGSQPARRPQSRPFRQGQGWNSRQSAPQEAWERDGAGSETSLGTGEIREIDF